MQTRQAALVVVALWIVLGLQGQVPPASSQPEPRDLSRIYKDNVLTCLRPALKAVGKVGRLYYRADCQPVQQPDPLHPYCLPDTLLFPLTAVNVPLKDTTGLAAVQYVFRDAKEVTVTEEQSGTIKILIGEIPDAILRTKMICLKLTPDEQYNPMLAIFAIEGEQDVQAAMSRLRYVSTVNYLALLVVRLAKGLPHLPSSMKNMTMDAALDAVAETFKGIVMYGACTQSDGTNIYDIDFRPCS